MTLILAQNVRVIEGFGQGAFTDQTHIHPVGLAMLFAAMVATFAAPRRYALVPLLLIMSLVPSAQRVALLSLDFPFLRILVIAALFRILIRGETDGMVWKRLDTLMVLWSTAAFAVMNLRTSGAAFVFQCGVTVDAVVGYFVARCLLREWSDLNILVRTASLVSLPVALAFLVENSTQRNLFAFFGGVPEITMVRSLESGEARHRCQGPYNHPILAGCFWASLLPLMAARWWQSGPAKFEALLAVAAALMIVFCCASSTPVFGVLGAVVGVACFLLRDRMRQVRWLFLLGLVGLHLMMNAPVWHLISRVSAVGGSTSYFRYMLLDSFINRFDEWALIGVNSTEHWFWGAQDLTNHFVAQGVTGGFLTLVSFVALIAVGFAGLGRAWRRFRPGTPECALAWALGVSLLVHVFNFFGVSYFGTITGLWYLTLGAIGSLSPSAISRGTVLPASSLVRRSPHTWSSVTTVTCAMGTATQRSQVPLVPGRNQLG